eukprot:2542225-Pyramimonas_sp.AAC.1
MQLSSRLPVQLSTMDSPSTFRSTPFEHVLQDLSDGPVTTEWFTAAAVAQNREERKACSAGSPLLARFLQAVSFGASV